MERARASGERSCVSSEASGAIISGVPPVRIGDDGNAARLRLEEDESRGLLPPLRRLRGQDEDVGAAHPVAHPLAIQSSRERHVGGSAFAQPGCQWPVSHEHEAMRAAPHEGGGRPCQVVHPLQTAERAHEQDDGLLARFCCVRGGRPPVRVDALIVDAQPRRIDARTQRNVRQVTGDGEQPTRALEGCRRGCVRSTRHPRRARASGRRPRHAASPRGARPSPARPPQPAGTRSPDAGE